jgi:hypothetical protein
MVSNKHELDKFLQDKLSLIEATRARNPQKAARGREVFMNQVEKLHKAAPAAVPINTQQRYGKGLFGLHPSFASLAIAIIVAATLLLGGTWGTVYAAQGSLPGDLLYSVKLAEENLRLALTGNSQEKVDLLTSYADRRVDEAIELASQGQLVPESLPDKMDIQLDELFILAADMDDTAMSQALNGVQIHLRDQDRDMTHVMKGLPEGVDPQLTRLQAMLQARQQLAATGIEEPNVFRHQFRNQENKPELLPTTPITTTITSTLTSTITTTITATSVITDTPVITGTLTPGQYGPGPCEDPGNCLPQGDGPGPGPFDGTPIPPQDQQGYGPGSDEGVGPQQPTLTPKPSKSSTKDNGNKSKP